MSVSLGRHLLVPLAVHGKVDCSKHTLGKPSLKHSEGLWFFPRCATSPGTAKGLLYRYPPVLRLRCTGGLPGHWESRLSRSSDTSNRISLRFSFAEHVANALFCFIISYIFLQRFILKIFYFPHTDTISLFLHPWACIQISIWWCSSWRIPLAFLVSWVCC